MNSEFGLTVGETISKARKILRKAYIESYELDSRILISYTLRTKYEKILLIQDQLISDHNYRTFMRYIEERSKARPIAYITHRKEFMSLNFYVNQSVLIPRPDSEILVETALDYIKKNHNTSQPLSILDLGTGSGCLLLSICHYAKIENNIQKICATGVDISKKAVKVARYNASRLNLSTQLNFIQSSWLDKLDESLVTNMNIIISNPPYIEPQTKLAKDLSYEPEIALYDKNHDTYKKILYSLAKYLDKFQNSPILIFEIGDSNQAKFVQNLGISLGFQFIKFLYDLSSNIRGIMFVV